MKYIALTLLAGCGGFTFGPPEDPTVCTTSQHAWSNFHLPHNALDPAVINDSSYTPDLAAWNDLGTPVQLRAGGSGFRIVIEDGGDDSSGWLGLASVSASRDGHIVKATVTMNRAILGRYNSRVADHVLCQEMGHLLGLGHQRNADDSCMDDCQGRGSGWLACLSSEEGTTPNAHDAQQLNTIYEHADDGQRPPADNCGSTILVHRFEVPGE